MNALTQNERDGLDDVFLSIHTHTDKYKKIKELSTLILNHKNDFDFKNLLKRAKFGLKSSFFIKYSKKKKNLSK